MKKSMRIISLLLALVMTGAVLVSCASDDGEDVGTTAGTVSTASGEDLKYVDELPALNFENEEINLFCSTKQGVHDEFVAEAGSSSKVSQAVHQRNVAVESRLGVKLNFITESSSEESTINNKLSTSVQSGDQSYDIVSSSTYVAARFVTQSNYRNLKTQLEGGNYLNLDKGYWSEGFNEIFSFGTDRQYLATGSAVISIYRLLYVTIYNKQMFLDVGEKDLYEVVKSGDWTVEYQSQIAKNFVNDTGDVTTSIYGLSTGKKISIDPYWVSFDCQILDKNAENMFELNNSSSDLNKLSDAVDKILALYNDSSNMVYDSDDDGYTITSKAIDPFCESRAAMATTLINNMELYIEKLADLSYGIVPMPKFDKDQDDYYSAVMDQVSSLGVSATVSDSDLTMMTAVLECLAAESYKTVVGAYYDEILNYRYLQDEQSQEMLKLTYEGSRMAMAAVYTGVLLPNETIGFTTMMRNFIVDGVNTVSSTFRAKKSQLTTGVSELNTAFSEIST